MAIDPNLERVEAAADALGPLIDELCLVGGCAAGVLITDTGASPVRPTEDVDLIVEAIHYPAYHAFCERLAERGFSQPAGNEDPICRWRQGGLIVDIMPVDETVLGFSSRWYKLAFETRRVLTLPQGSIIHHIDAPHFLATKLAAFDGRGRGDYVMSRDLEDLVRVVDGRPEVVEEAAACDEELRAYLASGIRALRADRHFVEALPGYFDDEVERAPVVHQRLERLASSAWSLIPLAK